jgi:hypothetical protein
MGPLYDPSDRFNTVAAWHMQTETVARSAEVSTPTP